jgi:predicted small secreted protein
MRTIVILLLLFGLSIGLIGCGETISGVSKDMNRMGRGANTFLFRQP